MTPKKFLDVRIECENESLLGINHINSLLNRKHDTLYTVTPLPELASKDEITNIIEQAGFAHILANEIAKILVGKVGKPALPSPEPEKEKRNIAEHIICSRCGELWNNHDNIKCDSISFKPPEKKELPEKLSFISGLTEFQDTINALIDIIREMREERK